MKVIYQLWQICDLTGNEFLMGTYNTRARATQEQRELEKVESGKYQYIIKCQEVKE